MTSLYYINDSEIISIQILIILNVANLFIAFFMFFVFIERTEYRHRSIQIYTNDYDNINTLQVRIIDMYMDVYSDDFPYSERCSICLEDFDLSNNSAVVKTTHCSHYYHEKCLKEWLVIRHTCPNCNVNLLVKYIEHYN